MSRELTVKELKRLVARAKEGDSEAFSFVYEQFYTPIFRYFYGRTRNKELSEDLTQDVFLKGYRSISSYQVEKVSPLAYFYTIARNCLIDYWRKTFSERLDDEFSSSLPDPEAKTDKTAIDQDDERILKIGLGVLSEEQKEILTLKYLNELTTKEIAEIVDKREDAVRQILSRSLKLMRQKLGKYEF